MNRSAIAAPPGGERVDIGSQLMLRLFGENTDSAASFAATLGDRASESPLRDLALNVAHPSQARYLAGGVTARFGEQRFALNDLSGERATSFTAPVVLSVAQVRFEPPSGPTSDSSVFTPPSGHFLAAYQPAPPDAAVSPAPGTVAFALPEVHTSDYVAGAPQSAAVRFESGDNGSSPQTPQIALHDASYNAGANFDVRAGKRTVNLNLSSGYEHVGNDTGTLSLGTTDSFSSWQLPGGAPLVIPSASDLNRLSLGAGFSVPVTRGLTLNLNYDAQRLYGGYGLPGLVNLDAVDNSYGGKLTFNIPRISSSLSISAYQDRFQDSIMPLNGYNATREDVNFTVKF
ncbi:MAG TPA: hypothetical protein VEW74_01970 [Candidatus Nitrosotalea sp.]|nr:hypothetical protein [Candidatus Nitrosotalea sp.]